MDTIIEGTVIADRLRIVEKIGAGTFGAVYIAEQIGFQRKVAVKLMNQALSGEDLVLTSRFEQEARILSQLCDRNIVRVYGYGYFQDRPYMITEYLEGATLDSFLNNKRLDMKQMKEVF